MTAEAKMYRSISVPVKATQFNNYGDHPHVYELDGKWYLHGMYGGTEVLAGDWIVEFATGEIHVVHDADFKLRFEQTKTFTKKELSAAVRMALQGDCA